MSLLLDTHAVLWWSSGDVRLGPSSRRAISAAGREVLISAISVWEITIKQALGRLDAPDMPNLIAVEGFRELPLTIEHGIRAGNLPPIHRDPFDRALVAQAMAGGLTLVTADDVLARYDVEVLDARS